MTITKTITLVERACPDCGITYAVPDRWLKEKQDTNGAFWCPNGCERHFCGETASAKAKRLERELRQTSDDRDWFKRRTDELANEAEHERNRAKGYKGQLTKVKKRISNGVCPCCNRFFENLHRHMATKHPDYAAQEDK